MAGTAYNDEGQQAQLYKFNGNEVLEGEGIPTTLNLMNFNARLYNPALGVFLAVDPMATSFAGLTPYNFGFNNPTVLSDPSGECPICVAMIIGAVIGGTTNGIITAKNGGNFWDGAWKGALVGAVGGAGGFGASALGAAMGVTGIVGGAAYGAATGSLIGGVSGGLGAALNGNSFGSGFGQGAKWGAIFGAAAGGIQGGISAAKDPIERNIMFGGATKKGKQFFLDELASRTNASRRGLNDIINDENLNNSWAETRPIIEGQESTLEAAMTNNPIGTRSNMYFKYKGRSLKQLESTFIHEYVHVQDYNSGFVGLEYLQYSNQYSSEIFPKVLTKISLEIRAYQSQVNFGFRLSHYLKELNRHQMQLWRANYNPFYQIFY